MSSAESEKRSANKSEGKAESKTEGQPESKTRAILGDLANEVPKTSPWNPTASAIDKAGQLGETEIQTVLRNFASMPQSTMIIANPPLYKARVSCGESEVDLKIRSYSIRGIVKESEIVKGEVGPYALFFVGLFGRKPEKPEEERLKEAIEQAFASAISPEPEPAGRGRSLVSDVARFVSEHRGLGPEMTMQYISVARKAEFANRLGSGAGVSSRREPGDLLAEMIDVQMENVAVGALSAYMNHLLRHESTLDQGALCDKSLAFVRAERDRGRTSLETSYSLLLGRPANDAETRILERMGTIQTHHGSAGSNMVARYLATLHAVSVRDIFLAADLAMEGFRHFGAIHDMMRFMLAVENLPAAERDEAIRKSVLGGGLPTFGHPEIAAAGRGHEVEQDPRPAIYLHPLFQGLESGEIQLNEQQRRRLGILERIYQIAFVEGVVKPGKEGQEPLRLTPNTDFGAWAVQESLGFADSDRTFLTVIFRGFGWMMDVREQMQQPIVRPVISPDPSIVPKADDDPTIPDQVVSCHERLARGGAFGKG